MSSITIYHDCRRLRKDGTAPVKLSVRFGSHQVQISTDVCLIPGQFNPLTQQVVGHPQRKYLNTFLSGKRLAAEMVVRELMMSGKRLTPALVRRCVENGSADESVGFIEYYRKVAGDQTKKERTREIYAATLKKLLAYAAEKGVDAETWTFEDITRGWVAQFDKWLSTLSPSRNARNIHLRNIRHVCNEAVADHVTTFYDFKSIHIKPEPTKKRSLRVEQIRELFSLDVESHQQKYLDCFKLIFFLIGINTIDLCHLKKSDVVEGRVEYKRSKTGHKYSIKVEKEAQDIIDNYVGQGEWLLDIKDRYTDFKDYAHRLNENLQNMGLVEVGKHGKKTRKPLFPELTTYWARHSWATIAASLDIPNETIAAALGHGYGNRITAIYIDFDMRKVDEANRRVIDWVLYGKK